jgi:hypothetical protein
MMRHKQVEVVPYVRAQAWTATLDLRALHHKPRFFRQWAEVIGVDQIVDIWIPARDLADDQFETGSLAGFQRHHWQELPARLAQPAHQALLTNGVAERTALKCRPEQEQVADHAYPSRTGARSFRTLSEAVCVLEMDRQATVTQWAQARTGKPPEVAQVTADKLEGAVGRLNGASYDYVFIDTPGIDSPGTNSAIRISDLCLIPCRSTPADLRAMVPTLAVLAVLASISPEHCDQHHDPT